MDQRGLFFFLVVMLQKEDLAVRQGKMGMRCRVKAAKNAGVLS